MTTSQLTEIIGLTAGTITSITFIPQVIRIWKTKSAKDLSPLMLFLLIIGTSLWLAFGLLLKSTPVIYTNTMVLAMGLVMVFFKFRFK